ncbi:PREDICTED: uncharacterized protein LOC105123633 [Populus euphratica]|uniref:Uncharacterized protein LOC105123633 n=1 Tax=Populus euphratica TaxID=75702 RepID=A0AAJ6U3G2_POPEU|nr:PREDICTED: uncharacterized protein LOC105123633 [Populus euphratica]
MILLKIFGAFEKLRRSLDDREEIEYKTNRSQGRKENCLVRVASRHARIAVKLGITKGVVNNLKELARCYVQLLALILSYLFYKLTSYFVFGRTLTGIVVQPAVINKEVKKSKNSLCIKLTKKIVKVKGKKRSLTIKQDEEKG